MALTEGQPILSIAISDIRSMVGSVKMGRINA